MSHNQPSHIASSYSNIIEQDDAQELNIEDKLQDITGGCIGCGILGQIASVDGGYTTSKGILTGNQKEVARGVAMGAIGYDSLNHASQQIQPCKHCVVNTALYTATKLA